MKKTLLLALALTSVTLAGCAEEAADETVIIDEAAAPVTVPADDMMMEGDSAMMDDAMAPEGDAMAPAADDSTAGL